MNKKTNTIRISKLLILCVCFSFAAIIFKVIYVSLDKVKVGNVSVSTFASQRNTVKKTIYATRGNIYDSAGETLAQNVNSYTVIAYLSPKRTTDLNNPKHVVDKETTANKLSEYINMTPEAILKLLKSENLYQIELGPGGRAITERVKEQIEALELPGIGFLKSEKRHYQMGNFASYILGYAKANDDGEIVGELGVEKYYNEELKGTDGSTTYQKDAYGYQIANTPSITVDAESGNDIYLTIDSQIQILAENMVSQLENETEFDWFMLAVADAKTGAVLASTSSPSFNPNKLDIKNYLNPLTQYAFEPGSTMKIFTFMAAMENGIYDGTKTYKSGSLTVADSTIYDWDRKGFGTITFDDGFNYSSNVAAATLGLEMGKDKLKDYLTKAGFGNKTGIELPESEGVINFNYKTEVATASYGQGITTTPIQILQGATAITNNGTVIQPYIVDKIVNPTTNTVVYKHEVQKENTLASTETVKKMQSLLKDAVQNGKTNASLLNSKKVKVIGKSGTAQIPSPKGGYLNGEHDYIYSVVGIFPEEEPKYIIYSAVKQLQTYYTKVSKKIVKFIEDIADFNNLSVKEPTQITKSFNLSSYVSKNIDDSIKELKDLGVNPIVIGDGKKIISQYPNKDDLVLKDSKVFLLTNSKEFTFPNIIGWSYNEISTYCSLIGLQFNVTGYGYVVKSSLNEGDKVDLTVPLEIELTK